MSAIPDAARTIIQRFPLGFVATVTADGLPAVSPKGTFLVLDDATLAFGDIRSPGTLANLALRPALEINFIDPFARKAARVRGIAEILPRADAGFAALLPRFAVAWPTLASRLRHIVRVAVTGASVVVTPPYDDGASEAEMVALYKRRFAEIYP